VAVRILPEIHEERFHVPATFRKLAQQLCNDDR
jgi:hypothetical protein